MNFLTTLSGPHPFVLSLLNQPSAAHTPHGRVVHSVIQTDKSDKSEKRSQKKKAKSHKKQKEPTKKSQKSQKQSRRQRKLEPDFLLDDDDDLPPPVAKPLPKTHVPTAVLVKPTATPAAQPQQISGVALGVSAGFLREFLTDRAIKEGMTTADVCRDVVLPRTQANKSSLHDVLQVQMPYAIGPATVFVSHAWKYNFREVMLVLLAYADECKQANKPTCFFYFDLFAHSQHSAPDYPQEWWSSTFKSRIGSIGTTLLVLSPWDDPVPLTRSWCLYELWSTMEQKANLVLRLPEAQQAAFKKALIADFNSVMAAMVKIDSERASAFHEKDRVMIAKTIQGSCGFSALNAQVKDQLREWLLATGQQLLRDHKTISADVRATAQFEISLGALTSQLGRYEDAAKLYKSAFKALQHTNPSGAATAAMNLGLAWGHKKNPSKVVKWMGRSLDLGKRSQSSTDVANIKIALGNAHIDQKNPSKALPMFLDALSECQKGFGETHHKTAFAYSNVGLVYQELKDYEKAAEYYSKAVQKYTITDGPSHPQTASAMHGLAVANLHMGKVSACIELEEKILKIYNENYGASHPFTKQTVKTLEVARKRADKPASPPPAVSLTRARQSSLTRALPKKQNDDEVITTLTRARERSVTRGRPVERDDSLTAFRSFSFSRKLSGDDLQDFRPRSVSRGLTDSDSDDNKPAAKTTRRRASVGNLLQARDLSRSSLGGLNSDRDCSEDEALDSPGAVANGPRGRNFSFDLTHARAVSCSAPFRD